MNKAVISVLIITLIFLLGCTYTPTKSDNGVTGQVVLPNETNNEEKGLIEDNTQTENETDLTSDTALNENEETISNETEEAVEDKVPTKIELKVGETAKTNKVEVTVKSTETLTDYGCC